MKIKKKTRKKIKKVLMVIVKIILTLAFLALLGFGIYKSFPEVYGRRIFLYSTRLDLSNTDLGDFSDLYRFRWLRYLDVTGDDLTVEQFHQIQSRFPACEIVWDVPMEGTRMDSRTESMEFKDIPTDTEMFPYFKSLKTITITEPSDRDAVLVFRDSYSQYDVRWYVYFQEQWLSPDTKSFEFEGSKGLFNILLDNLPYFVKVEDITVNGAGLTMKQQLRLRELYPQITFHWTVEVANEVFDTETTKLQFSESSHPSLSTLEDALKLLPNVSAVDFDGSGITGETRRLFRDEHPELKVTWTVYILGESIPLDTKTLDYSNRELSIEDVYSIRDGAYLLPELETIEMHETGVDYAILNELNETNDRVRYIWTVHFANYTLRTDAKFFMPGMFEDGEQLFNRNSRELRYCIDLECLDLGHSAVQDLSFLRYMPHMKYLILADSSALDLQGIQYCKELVFLEAFCTYISDISPLLQCTALEDLNIGYIRSSADDAFEVLRQMTWLKRLWYCATPLSRDQISELKEILSGTECYIRTGGQSTGSTWRLGQNYYDMRDLLGMYYMPGGTLGVNSVGWQVIEDDFGERFTLVNWDGEQKWWEQDAYKDWNWHFYGINVDMP